MSSKAADTRYTLRAYSAGGIPTVVRRLSEHDAIARARAGIVRRDEANALVIDLAGQLASVGRHSAAEVAQLLGITRATATDWLRVASAGVDLIDAIAQGRNLTSVYVVSKAIAAGTFDLQTGLKLLRDCPDMTSFRAAMVGLGLDMSGKRARAKVEKTTTDDVSTGAVAGTMLQQAARLIDKLSVEELEQHIMACSARLAALQSAKAKAKTAPAKAKAKTAPAKSAPAAA